MSRLHPMSKLSRWLGAIVLGALLIWTLFPLWWALALSIKQPQDFFTAKFIPFWQFRPTLDNWRAEWIWFDDPAGLGRGLANSALVAAATALISLVLGGLAAFGLILRRYNGLPVWRLVTLILLPRVLTPIIWALPFSLLMVRFHLQDTRLALIFAHTTLTLPLAVLILHSAMKDIPMELLDAARVDGANWLTALGRIVAPLLAPAALATGALCIVQSWNEFLFALMNVQQRAQTAPLAIASLITKDGIEFKFVGAHLVMVMLPPLLLALAAQQVIVRGLSLGALTD